MNWSRFTRKKGFLRSAGMLAVLVLGMPAGIHFLGGSSGDAWGLTVLGCLAFLAVISLPSLIRSRVTGGGGGGTIESRPAWESRLIPRDREAERAESEEMNRREKDSFRRACVFLGLAVSGGLFTFIYDLTVRRQIMGLAKPKERHWRLEELKRDVDLLEILVFFLTVAFLVYFAKWLAALHRRRRKGLDQGPSFRTLNRPHPDDSRSRDTR